MTGFERKTSGEGRGQLLNQLSYQMKNPPQY